MRALSVEWLSGVSGVTETLIVGPEAATATPAAASIVTPNVASPLKGFESSAKSVAVLCKSNKVQPATSNPCPNKSQVGSGKVVG